MKKIIVALIILALCPIRIIAQLVLNSSFNKKYTVLNISLENSSNKKMVGVFSEFFHSGDGGSYIEWCFFNKTGDSIAQSKYGFIVNNTPKRLILINPNQKLNFLFKFPLVKNKSNLYIIRIKIWLKYSFIDDTKPNEEEYVKEFLLE